MRSGLSSAEGLPQAGAAVAERDVEAVHLEIVADHVAGGGLVVDDEDVLGLTLMASPPGSAGSTISKVAPVPGPSLVASMRAAVQLDDALGDRQAEPGRALAAGRLRREALEAAEQPRHVLRREPGALVAHADRGDLARARSSRTSMAPPVGLYLMALLTRLSTASRRRSWSPLAVTATGAARARWLWLLALGERPVGRRRPRRRARRDRSAADGCGCRGHRLMASAIRVSTISVRRRADIADVVDLRARRGSIAGMSVARMSDSISVRPRMTPSGFFRSWATVPRISLLKRVGAAQAAPPARRGARWPWSARACAARPAPRDRMFASCSCS